MTKAQILLSLACFASSYGIAAWTSQPAKTTASPSAETTGSTPNAKFSRTTTTAPLEAPPDPAINLRPLEKPPKASLLALIDELASDPDADWGQVEAAVLWWLQHDASDCLGKLPHPGDLPAPAVDRISAALLSFGSSHDVEELRDLAAHPTLGGFTDTQVRLLDMLAPRVWTRGRSAIEAMRDGLEFSVRASFIAAATRHCPDAEAEAWADELAADHQWHLIVQLPQLQSSTGRHWLSAWLEGQPDEVAAMLQNFAPYRNLRYLAPIEGSLDDFLDQLAGAIPDGESEAAHHERELDRVLSARLAAARAELLEMRPSPLLQFSRGEITAAAFVEALPGDFDILLKGAPDATRKQLFPLLAAANPREAVAWLDDLPAQEKHALILGSADSLAREPRRLLELFNAYPYNPSQGPLQSRFRIWTGTCLPGYEQFGDAYAEWMISLPTSVERDMALGALAHDLRSVDPGLASRLLDAKNFTPPGR